MSSQDSVVVLSEDEEEEAARYLKIYYQESEEFLDVPLESNRNVLSEDITLLDSRISALIIQKHGSKRIVKLKDKYVKEPKEKWKNVKVYAVLKKERESVTSAESSYPSVTNKCNTKIESETPTILNYHQSVLINSLPSSLKVRAEQNNIKPVAPESSSSINCNVPASERQNLSFKSTCKTGNSSDDLTTITDIDDSDSDVGELDSDDDKLDAVIASNVKETPAIKSNESATSIMPVKEPTSEELLLAYKVSSLATLKVKLCRGNAKYGSAFEAFIRRLKRTMVAYPNNEFVRLIYYAQMTDVMVKNLDSTAKDYCELCDDEDFTLKHLISSIHVCAYRQKYKADPPEIAILLNPEVYEKCIDPLVLKELKIMEYKKMEESSEFSIIESNEELFKLKYILINRIIQENLVAQGKHDFSFIKFAFLRNVYSTAFKAFFKFFRNTNFECQTCKKVSQSFHDYLQHILSESHLQNALNQKEFNNICKAMSIIGMTLNGYCFLTSKDISRKRKHSSDNIQNGVKCYRKS